MPSSLTVVYKPQTSLFLAIFPYMSFSQSIDFNVFLRRSIPDTPSAQSTGVSIFGSSPVQGSFATQDIGNVFGSGGGGSASASSSAASGWAAATSPSTGNGDWSAFGAGPQSQQQQRGGAVVSPPVNPFTGTGYYLLPSYKCFLQVFLTLTRAISSVFR